MNSKILNCILNGELKPWLISFDDERILKDIIKQVKNNPNETTLQVQANLNALLKPFPALLKGLNFTPMVQLEPQSFGSNLPKPVTLFNHFYKAIIDAEIARYFNATIHNPLIKDNTLDVPFQIGHQSLIGIAGLCNQTNNEIIERGFISNNTAITDTSFFALTYLRNSLLALYFAIQKPFKEYLTTTYNSFEDYALYCLDDANFEFSLTEIETKNIEEPVLNKKSNALTFGFRGDEERLFAVVKSLVFRIYFLNEKLTTVEQFIEVFTAKDLKGVKTKIHIECATNEFEEIMRQFKSVASKFTPTSISKSKLFYTKEGTLIDDNLLYVTKSKSKIATEKKDLISAIFQNISKEKG
jgi:hypothetical protein